MDEYNDKSETVEFRPIKEEKQHINRSEEDVYSSARRNVRYDEKENGSSDRKLIYIAVILAVLLIIAIAAGVFILKAGKPAQEQNELPVEENNLITENAPEEEAPEKEVISSYNIVFYGDSVIKKNGVYTILADLYNSSFEKEDNRKLVINGDTDIRENGKRLSAEGLVYAVERMAGEGVVFEGKIRESDNVVISISYDGSFREEIEAETEEEPGTAEGEENNSSEQENPEQGTTEEVPPQPEETQPENNEQTGSEGILQ